MPQFILIQEIKKKREDMNDITTTLILYLCKSSRRSVRIRNQTYYYNKRDNSAWNNIQEDRMPQLIEK